MTPHLSIAIATQNRGKLTELTALFEGLPVALVPYATLVKEPRAIAEDGATFEDNARIKAKAVADETMMVTLADDSGLEVDALGGRPGVRSARFAKEGATDSENNAALLTALEELEDDQRQARFRCVLVLFDPYAEEGDGFIVVEGRCDGTIARRATGTGGFGYDPLFVVDGIGRTMAELDEAEKNRLSHRALAAVALRPAIAALAARRLESSVRILSGDAAARDVSGAR